MSKAKKITYRAPTKESWMLAHGVFEVFWKKGRNGLYADRVRVDGATFYYCGTRPKLKRKPGEEHRSKRGKEDGR